MNHQVAMCDAITTNNMNILSYMLNIGYNPNFELYDGISPLTLAMKFRNSVAIKLLMKHGAIPNVKPGVRSLLHDAVVRGKVKAVEMLLMLNTYADDVFYKDGMTPLYLATKLQKVEIMKTLLKYKADPDISSTDKTSTLHLAVMMGDVNMTKLLIKHKATLDLEDGCGYTPLLYAVAYKNIAICKVLLDSGANPNYVGRNGDVALLCAVENNRPDIVRLLISRGADCNIMTTIEGEYCTILDVIKNYCVNLKTEAIGALIAEIVISIHKKTRRGEGFKNNTSTIEDTEEFLEVKTKCIQELTYMKSQKIGKKSLYEMFILENNTHQQNENVLARNVKKILTVNNEIHLYGYLLREAVKISLKRSVMLKTAISVTDDEINQSKWTILPYEVKYLIMEKLSNSDIINIIPKVPV
ncbi:SWPV2-ORF145 [Shearwaterpox virus]|uniref:SWPV2-ORF145 n=1 Tax=Shearwaterpox virus TaxID=1974596 RepID=A0A1V0QGA5_CNPV|nr:SWPV2-ORF145 [Shearwaterpox virus]QRI42869.1 ankyrin repeat protein [Cheloniid poxvirus 1]QRM15428.1 ankyrin repeat protein [Mudlarkpox virus]QRM15784.1 ankyrin repeat protein [Penguinpox virus 2]QRM16116.1 ankyrin repeat protein [Albatrosspox virus]